MNEHTLVALEFYRVLQVVAEYATSEPGAEAVRALRPVRDGAVVAAALDEVDEMVSWRPIAHDQAVGRDGELAHPR